MITPLLVGRLANQMFQISAAIALAKRHGQELHIPTESTSEKHWPATFKHLANPKYSRFAPVVKIKERSHAYNEIIWSNDWADSNVVLDGFFQSEKYFEDYIDEVRQAFNIPYVRQDHFVGIHVRRGDYVTQFPDKHPAQPYKYYRDAVAYFREYGYKSFVVCSDDIPWCREKFAKIKQEFNDVAFTMSEGLTPLQDMSLLMSCDHHVISASTFGLMAHILCPYADKFCIAPEVWFGSGNRHLDSTDIYPKNCVKL